MKNKRLVEIIFCLGLVLALFLTGFFEAAHWGLLRNTATKASVMAVSEKSEEPVRRPLKVGEFEFISTCVVDVVILDPLENGLVASPCWGGFNHPFGWSIPLRA